MAKNHQYRNQQTTEAQSTTPDTPNLAPESSINGDQADPVQTSTEPDITSATPISASPALQPLTDGNLSQLLATASPEQLARIRALAAGAGLDTGSKLSRRTADGGMNMTVHLSPEIVTQLEAWAEGSGHGIEDEAQLRIREAITAYLYGDWGAAQMKPATTAAAEAATATGATTS